VLYVVTKSTNSSGSVFRQRLHVIDLTTGAEEPGAPLAIAASSPGNGDGGTSVSFNPQTANQRAGLALVGGSVYIAWGSHEDARPFYGWLIGYTYNGSSLTRTHVLNVVPNYGLGGIWMSGSAPAADSSNQLYVSTGNGVFDADSNSAPNNDYGDSFLKLSPSLSVVDYFTPSDQQSDESNNNDFGAGGAAVLGDLPAGSAVSHLAIAGGKDGYLYVFNRDSLGGFGDSNALQKIQAGQEGSLSTGNPGVIFSSIAFWNNTLYLAAAGEPLIAFQLNKSGTFSFAAAANAPRQYGFPGSTPSVSSSGSINGIVWAVDGSQYCTTASPGCGPAVLHAYDAADITDELWNSSMSSGDAAGYAIKFAVPTVANGKVYVGTRGNNRGGSSGSTSVAGELEVYGLKP
jgi:hypothetical protein